MKTIIALLFVSSIAWAEPCEIVILANECPAGLNEVRQSWPLPDGCTCPTSVTDWNCWLNGREASAAQDLGLVDKGKHHWRVQFESCKNIDKKTEFISTVETYVPVKETAKSIEIQKDGKVVLKGGYSGKEPVMVTPTAEAVAEAIKLEAEAKAAAEEMMKPKIDAGTKEADAGVKVIK